MDDASQRIFDLSLDLICVIDVDGTCVDALGGTITEPAWRSKPTWYLVATDDHMIPPPLQRTMAEPAGATVAQEVASHSIYVSQPRATAELIKQAAQRALSETPQAVG